MLFLPTTEYGDKQDSNGCTFYQYFPKGFLTICLSPEGTYNIISYMLLFGQSLILLPCHLNYSDKSDRNLPSSDASGSYMMIWVKLINALRRKRDRFTWIPPPELLKWCRIKTVDSYRQKMVVKTLNFSCWLFITNTLISVHRLTEMNRLFLPQLLPKFIISLFIKLQIRIYIYSQGYWDQSYKGLVVSEEVHGTLSKTNVHF